MNKLIWVYDSPFSRSIKWLLSRYEVPHEDYVLTWDEMSTDPLLACNPKKQVPTIWCEGKVKTDSLLIALDYLPSSWHKSVDAQLFRLADSDVEAAIIFLFRANLLKDKFGESENSQLMLKAGIDTFQQSIDHLLDHVLNHEAHIECNYGAVLLLSTIFAAISLAEDKLIGYRATELAGFIAAVESNKIYKEMIHLYQGKGSNSVPFEYSKFNHSTHEA